MVSTRRSVLNNTSLSSSVEVAPPKKLKVSTRRRRSVPNTSSSTSRPVKVAPPKKELEESTISTTPSEIPKDLYDLIQNAAKARESLKRNPDNRFAKSKLEDYEHQIHRRYLFYRYKTDQELPDDWRYDPKTSFMDVPKPPLPPKPKTQEEEKNKQEEEKKKRNKKKKKEIQITWSSPNYHGSYPLNDDYVKDVWKDFSMKDTTEARDLLSHPIDKFLNMVDKDHKVVDLLGRFAVDTFNRSCQMYVNNDEANQVSGAEFMECKFFKLPETYIFYITMEAIEQGIHGVYETKVQCDTEDGEMTLWNFKLTDREPKWNRPRVKPRELEVEYETVQDGSSDPQDFYELTGLVHRVKTKGGGFNYHNPIYSTHRIICYLSEDKTSRDFVPNVSQPPLATKNIPMDR